MALQKQPNLFMSHKSSNFGDSKSLKPIKQPFRQKSPKGQKLQDQQEKPFKKHKKKKYDY